MNTKKLFFKKKGLMSFLLLLFLLLPLVAQDMYVPPIHDIDALYNREVVYNYELIQQYEFEKALGTVYFTPPTLHDSGIISLAVLDNNGPSKIYGFDENFNKRYIGKFVSWPYSYYGKYFDVSKTINDNQIKLTLMDNKGNKYYSLIDNKRKYDEGGEFLIRNLNDNGECLISYYSGGFKIKMLNGIDKQLENIKYDNRTARYYSHSLSALSNNGNCAICLGDDPHDKAKGYHSFPLGSRVFLYDKDAKFVKSYDIEGTKMTTTARYSDSGRYFIMQNSGFLYIFVDNELVVKKDTKGVGPIFFSPDESLVLIGSGLGNLIVELPSCKVIKNLGIFGTAKSIANKGYPIIACAALNELYVVNYETEEVMLAKGPKNPRTGGINRVQLSGDGKMLTYVHNKWYKKYKIGERKR